MKILSLEIANFKGIKHLLLEPNGSDLTIFGENATGKSTVADSWSYLLYGRDSMGQADFDIKPLDADGKVVPGLMPTVRAVLEVGGERLTLTKTYKEVWTKSKGKAKAEFDGHTIDHEINGVPVQQKEFDARVASLCDPGVGRMLTDPLYFADTMKWQDRRKVLLAVCGEVSDADVIASNSALRLLPDVLGGRTPEETKAILDKRRKEINGKLETLPVRIDEVQRSKPEAKVVGSAEAIEEQLSKLQERRANVVAGGELAELNQQLAQIVADIQQLDNEHLAGANAAYESAMSDVRKQSAALNEKQLAVSKLESEVRAKVAEIESMDRRLDALRAQGAEEYAKTFTPPSVPEVCAACGQRIPIEDIEKVTEAARQLFNEQKASTLAQIKEQGQALKAAREELAKVILEMTATAERLTAELEAEAKRIEALRASISTPQPSANPLKAEKVAQRLDIEQQISVVRGGLSQTLSAIDDEIAVVKSRLAAVDEARSAAQRIAEADERIKQLEAEEQKLAEDIEQIDGELHMLEQFTRAKVSMLNERINERFDRVRFRLFDMQVNGLLVECCDLTVGGVPYGSLNHAARINAGIECINVLADHFGIAPPVVIDGAESVTRLLPTRGQQIRLLVSEEDKTLRVLPSQTHDLKQLQEALI